MRHPNIRVVVGKDENLEKSLRKFKKLCEKAGIKKECKSRRYYEKPSEAKRRKIRKAERNNRKGPTKSDYKNLKKNSQKSWIFTHPKLTNPSDNVYPN